MTVTTDPSPSVLSTGMVPAVLPSVGNIQDGDGPLLASIAGEVQTVQGTDGDNVDALRGVSILVGIGPRSVAGLAMERRGARWLKTARRGLPVLKRQHAFLHARVAGVLT